jgi:vacuolar-type H+-ATPase subunit I/STV1
MFYYERGANMKLVYTVHKQFREIVTFTYLRVYSNFYGLFKMSFCFKVKFMNLCKMARASCFMV